MSRCFHPKNYSITWCHQLHTEFRLQNGDIQIPQEDKTLAKPHVRFECHDCGFMAYYAAHNAPHWFAAKMAAVGTGFSPKEDSQMSRTA